MKRVMLLFSFLFFLTSCGDPKIHNISGKITSVDKVNKIIKIDDKPIKLYFVDAYVTGQKVEVTFIDKTPDKDCWCPDHFEVQEIKIINDDNRKD